MMRFIVTENLVFELDIDESCDTRALQQKLQELFGSERYPNYYTFNYTESVDEYDVTRIRIHPKVGARVAHYLATSASCTCTAYKKNGQCKHQRLVQYIVATDLLPEPDDEDW